MWLLDETIVNALNVAIDSGFEPSAQQTASFIGTSAEISLLEGSVAKIEVNGVLTPKPDIMAALFGGGNTTYSQIVDSVKAADEDSNVASIDMYFDTPGGHIDGLFEAMDTIRNTKKPVRAIVMNRATSAGYGLAAQADTVLAFNRASSVGSIGIVVQGRVRNDVVTITSSNAPFKRPDISTDVGKAIVRNELDEVEDLFVQAIALGRDLSAQTVVADYGKGMTFLANEAMRRGMVDGIGISDNPEILAKAPNDKTTANLADGKSQLKVNAMNITELKAEHPSLYDQIFALGRKEGVDSGGEVERKRVAAHLKLGNKFNAMDIAVKACEDGTDVADPMAIADYMSAMADARDLSDFKADGEENSAGDGDAASGSDTTAPEENADTEQEIKDKEAASNILELTAERLGLEMKAEA